MQVPALQIQEQTMDNKRTDAQFVYTLVARVIEYMALSHVVTPQIHDKGMQDMFQERMPERIVEQSDCVPVLPAQEDTVEVMMFVPLGHVQRQTDEHIVDMPAPMFWKTLRR